MSEELGVREQRRAFGYLQKALKAGLTIPNFYFLTPTCFYRSKEILYASCNQDQPQG